MNSNSERHATRLKIYFEAKQQSGCILVVSDFDGCISTNSFLKIFVTMAGSGIVRPERERL